MRHLKPQNCALSVCRKSDSPVNAKNAPCGRPKTTTRGNSRLQPDNGSTRHTGAVPYGAKSLPRQLAFCPCVFFRALHLRMMLSNSVERVLITRRRCEKHTTRRFQHGTARRETVRLPPTARTIQPRVHVFPSPGQPDSGRDTQRTVIGVHAPHTSSPGNFNADARRANTIRICLASTRAG